MRRVPRIRAVVALFHWNLAAADEARAIARGALGGKISELRPKLSHDLQGVFEQARSSVWGAGGITDIKAFEEALRERDALVVAARLEVVPRCEDLGATIKPLGRCGAC